MTTTEMIKQLREKTGAGIMECKSALEQYHGNLEKAAGFLKEKGLTAAKKKADRIAAEGVVDAYIHGNGRIGVLLEVNIETDFAALNKEFRALVKDLGMQIAAAGPQYIRREDIPAEVVERERKELKTQALYTGKPEKIIEKIVEGRLEKFYQQVCLLEQSFIKEPEKTVRQILNDKILTLGENIVIRRFIRFEMGEGLMKKEENFAEEVMKQVSV